MNQKRKLKAERKHRQYVRRHQEAAHDAGAWLMINLLRARWDHLQKGPDIGIWPDIPLSFQGARVRMIFRRAGAITPADIAALPSDYAAVCRVLQARAAGEQFSGSDLESLNRSLNFPITLGPSDDHRFIERVDMGSRLTVELLIAYLDSLVWSHVTQAIGVCECCNGLFLRIKANQTACSDKCRLDFLKASGYWSPKNLKARRQRRMKAKVRAQKAVGISEGELSEKRRKIMVCKGKK